MRLYLDTAPVIYVVQRVSPFFTPALTRMTATGVSLVASDLTRMESRILPMRKRDIVLIREFDNFFDRSVTEVLTLSREIMNRAAEIRAEYNFKTPDSIHLAAAVESGCDVFYTNDHRLDRCKLITIEVI
jgi:uncharacterized protein